MRQCRVAIRRFALRRGSGAGGDRLGRRRRVSLGERSATQRQGKERADERGAGRIGRLGRPRRRGPVTRPLPLDGGRSDSPCRTPASSAGSLCSVCCGADGREGARRGIRTPARQATNDDGLAGGGAMTARRPEALRAGEKSVYAYVRGGRLTQQQQQQAAAAEECTRLRRGLAARRVAGLRRARTQGRESGAQRAGCVL